MRDARALVFPSLWAECQPLVPLEALRQGVPVIAGRWTAAAEAIEDGETGIVVPDRDGFAAALTRMTPDVAGAMSRHAHAKRDSYGLTPESHAEALLRVYAQVLARD